MPNSIPICLAAVVQSIIIALSSASLLVELLAMIATGAPISRVLSLDGKTLKEDDIKNASMYT